VSSLSPARRQRLKRPRPGVCGRTVCPKLAPPPAMIEPSNGLGGRLSCHGRRPAGHGGAPMGHRSPHPRLMDAGRGASCASPAGHTRAWPQRAATRSTDRRRAPRPTCTGHARAARARGQSTGNRSGEAGGRLNAPLDDDLSTVEESLDDLRPEHRGGRGYRVGSQLDQPDVTAHPSFQHPVHRRSVTIDRDQADDRAAAIVTPGGECTRTALRC
jgi:hypothetical protein